MTTMSEPGQAALGDVAPTPLSSRPLFWQHVSQRLADVRAMAICARPDCGARLKAMSLKRRCEGYGLSPCCTIGYNMRCHRSSDYRYIKVSVSHFNTARPPYIYTKFLVCHSDDAYYWTTLRRNIPISAGNSIWFQRPFMLRNDYLLCALGGVGYLFNVINDRWPGFDVVL